MVTEPDISSGAEAVEFLTKYKSLLVFAGVADCKMEQGGLRCDVNLSVKRKGQKELGTRTEMKNLNSFKMVQRAIEYEAKRQIEELEAGKHIVQETRKWDDNRGKSFAMRSKEESQDYRYFPDPDILAVKITQQDIDRAKSQMPESAMSKKERYVHELKLPEYDAKILTMDKQTALFFESVLALTGEAKETSNWIMTDVLKKCKEKDVESKEEVISSKNLAYIINATKSKQLTRVNAKELFERVCFTKLDAKEEAEKLGFLSTISSLELDKLINDVFLENQKAILDYEKEPVKVENYFIGQLMKKTAGKADVAVARMKIHEKLEKK